MARTRCAGIVVTVLVAAVLAACGGVGEQAVGEDGHLLFVHRRSLPAGGMDALVVGELAVADGCVLLVDEAGGRYPVVWPAGTDVAEEDPLVLELPSGDRLGLGQSVTGAGGYVSPAAAGIEVPDACLGQHGDVALFNLTADPTVDGDG